MMFLQPFILWGLPLALLPIAIHLVNRMRHQKVAWAASRFLAAAAHSSTRWARLRQLLILVCRVLLLAFLITALAQPLAVGGWGQFLSGPPGTVILLLDRSCSMQMSAASDGITKNESALKLLRGKIAEVAKHSFVVCIDSATQHPRPLLDPDLLLQNSYAGPTETSADIPALFQQAFQYLLSQGRDDAVEMWLVSDLRAADWQPQSSRWKAVLQQFEALPQEVSVRLFAYPSFEQTNASVQIKEIVNFRVEKQTITELIIAVKRPGAGPITMPLTISSNGREEHLQLELDTREKIVHHQLKLNKNEDLVLGKVAIPVDSQVSDNFAYFGYDRRVPRHTVVVAESAEVAKILELAAVPDAEDISLESCERLSALQMLSSDLSTTSLVVWQGEKATPAVEEKLRDFVAGGGVVLLLPPSLPAASFSILGVELHSLQQSQNDRSAVISEWDREQGPLADTVAGEIMPVDSLHMFRYFKAEGNATVLASTSTGASFLLAKKSGLGSIYSCATLPLQEWSTLADGLILVPLMQRLATEGCTRLSRITSDVCASRERRFTAIEMGPANGRDGTRAGIFRDAGRFYVLNRSPQEDAVDVLDDSEVQNLLRPLPMHSVESAKLEQDKTIAAASSMFIWLAIVSAILEATLASDLRKRQEKIVR